MVRKLFNDLVTTLDILPTSSTVDVCVNHPSTCVLSGKVRIIAKRPCVYKSLVITVTGSTRVWLRQGAKTFKAKQIFLQSTQQIVHEPSLRRGRSPSTLDILDPTLSAPEQLQQQSIPEIARTGSGDELDDSSPITHIHHEHSVRHTTPPPEEDQLASGTLAEAPLSPAVGSPDSQMAPVLNQLVAGVNDIEFTIEFPSHVQAKDDPESASSEMRLSCLPSGPMKTTCGDSSITYTLSAALVMSRRDILVNNNMSTSIPFRVQNWQDSIDGRHSEDHAYHGKRRGKVEFQFQVPKQLDTRRLHELQFWFQASWRTLSDSLKVKEVQYYLIEEEQQTFAARLAPHIYTTIISTTASHDVSAHATPTNTWDHLRTPIRLQIPQPNTVLESSSMPWPHPLLVSHKLRVLIKFDQTEGKERDLQLSFPILIHPTMDDHGSPVHPLPMDSVPARPRRRRGRQLYGIESGPMDADGEDDDDILPLPMYADREGTLLLMVGEEIQETDLQGFELDALGISTSMGYPDQSVPYSPSITSISSSSPISPTPPGSSFLIGPTPVQGEQHTWTSMSRPVSMMPSTSEHASHFSVASRRFSSIESATDPFLPPPYRFPSVDEEPTSPTTSVVSSSSVWETHTPSPSSPESASWLHQYQSSGHSLSSAPATRRHRASASEQGYSASTRSSFTPRITTLASTSSTPNTIDSAAGPFATFYGGMPSPPYEYEEDSSRSAGRLGRGSTSTPLSL
ncbi:hypothetical protein BGZ75_009218 [Mortierella antarctica]|nr:hypothetical protein BGZ75_009218 [Mortierella antarctica]